MIYICYIKYCGNAEICVLVVGSDELIVGDDEDASSEAAEGRRAGGFWDITWLVLDLSCGHG